MDISTRYDASSVESKWYLAWEQAGLFKESGAPGKPKFTITIPPPNITGSLHMGHSLCYPTQDLIGRFMRLKGHDVLIVPGQDHAGIATQSVVSKQLKAQGIQPSELGREKFIEKTWEWRDVSGDTIIKQFRMLGCAFDWSRSRFTLDDAYVKAVLTVFIDWYEKGLIYRGKRIVNWDPVLKTSVSDIETLREDIKGKLYHVRYPFSDGSGEVIIATTRPETMLGDVAVAVHPSDARYSDKIGKKLILPLVGREIPLVADQYPDPEFGTGAVKITPAHDPNDYEVGMRQGLPMPVIMDDSAKIIAEGPYFGLSRTEARKRIVADLEEQGFMVKIEDHNIAIIKSDRSGEIIEPLLSEQWFVKQTELAGPGIAAVKSGEIKFTPERFSKVYLDWMENIRDWCISRQLWWGHRIPVYYTEGGSHFAALSWEEAQAKAGDEKIVRQDDDVLDTWFSSGLWPFATLGWPEKMSDLAERYPTTVLVTDRNIIYLWVARMIMMGIDFCDQIPFTDVCIHATVMTEDGKRMSKSLGTGVDPTEVIAKIGADALRYTLLSQAGQNQEIRYSERRTEDARNFCNKIWNASRFALMSIGEEPLEQPGELNLIDKWIISRLYETEKLVNEAYGKYDFQQACAPLYHFFWNEFCDWYIELSKSRFSDPAERNTTGWVLLTVLDSFLKMLHPVMPHLTEEIYSHLPIAGKSAFIMSASWPELPESFSNPEAESQVAGWFEMVRALRALRADIDVDPKKVIPSAYYVGDLRGGEDVIKSQAWIENLIPGESPSSQNAGTTIEGVDFVLPTDGLIDIPKMIAKLQAESEKMAADLVKLEARLNNPMFVERAKPEVIEKDREIAADLADRIQKNSERIVVLSK
jgi:valyl-tRNA synthetase